MCGENCGVPRGKRIMSKQEKEAMKQQLWTVLNTVHDELHWIEKVFDQVIFVIDENKSSLSDLRKKAYEYAKNLEPR
jgi:hypothetical protein